MIKYSKKNQITENNSINSYSSFFSPEFEITGMLKTAIGSLNHKRTTELDEKEEDEFIGKKNYSLTLPICFSCGANC